MLQNARRRCPHVEAPFPECYVSNLSSIAVERAIDFCSGDFEKCDIYVKHHLGKGGDSAKADAAAQLTN